MFFSIPYALFGLIIGSFLNVVILRHGARSLSGRSGCMSCGAPLKWYDLLPVVSWLLLRGKCRRCHAAISIQYPLVELTNAVLFGFIGGSILPLSLSTPALVIASTLLVIAVYDIRHTIIPDEWVLVFIISSLFYSGINAYNALLIWPDALWLLLGGPIAALPLFCLWFFSKGAWMGFGDVKLALGMGWFLGPLLGIYAVFAAFVIGAVISVVILLPLPYILKAIRMRRLKGMRSGFTMKSEVAFGPFLIAATMLVWFASLNNATLPFLNL